jgi:hypothetical protein
MCLIRSGSKTIGSLLILPAHLLSLICSVTGALIEGTVDNACEHGGNFS